MKIFFVFIFSLFFIVSTQGQSTPKNNNRSFGITLSFPWLNFYNYYDYKENISKNKSGFFGLGIATYYQKDKNKISFNVGTTEDLSSPVGIIDYSDKGQKINIGSTFAELIYHRTIYNSFGGIIGLNFINYKYQYINYTDHLPVLKRADKTLGYTIGAEYKFNKFISAALFYRPILGSFEADDYYRHLISVDIRINLELKKKRKINQG